MKNIEGTMIPAVSFRTRVNGAWRDVTTREVFAGKRVVVFALPGAFTPTCSSSHVPRYNELYPAFRAAGVDTVACVSVNDAFVMDAWKADQAAEHITFLPDGNGEFTRAMGALVDKQSLGFGQRSWRYAMLVENGEITRMFIEPEVEGDPFQVSDADTVLRALAPTQRVPHDVVLFSRPGCAFCVRARKALEARGWAYDELPASPRRLRAVSGKTTTPQVFIDGHHLGGAEELEHWLAQQPL